MQSIQMASDSIPIDFLCESNICYIYIPDANTQESIDRILAIQYSYSIRVVSTVYNGYSDIAGDINLRPNYHYNHYITISNKFCMAYM